MTPDRMDEYRQYASVARTIGVNVSSSSRPTKCNKSGRSRSTDGLIGAIRHPDDGYIQPADLTQALARGARSRGATIRVKTCVTAIERAGGEWLIRTDAGDILCEHVVTATGSFARRTGAMVGLDIPVLPVEHQYIVTEAHDEIVGRRRAGQPEMGVLRESDGSWYMREEAGGLLLGPYEKGAPACYLDGPDPDAEYELFNAGPGSAHATHRVRHPPRAGLRRTRHQANLQRRHPLHARRQPHHRPGMGLAELLAERRPQLRHHRRRRRRLAACRVDRRGRTLHRHAGGRSAPLRRLRHPRLPQGEDGGGLRQRLHRPLSRRGTARRAPASHRALLRANARFGCRVRAEVRLGASQLVRAGRLAAAGRRQGGAGRSLVVPPLTLVRGGGGGVSQRARQRGTPRHDRVRQGSGERTRRPGFPEPAGGEPPAPHRSHCAHACPERTRRRAFGVHHLARIARFLLSRFRRGVAAARPRLPQAPDAERRLGSLREPDRLDGRAGGGGAEVARTARAGLRRGSRQRRLPVALRATGPCGPCRGTASSGSTSSANSAGRFTTASNTRTPSSMP